MCIRDRVPAINNFLVNDIKLANLPEQEITVYFSDPIAKNQDFTGRFEITGRRNVFKTLVDGNTVKLFPSRRLSGDQTLTISPGIKNTGNGKLEKTVTWKVAFDQEKPMVEMVGSGNILPDSKGLIFPFDCLLYTSPSPRDATLSRMPSSA